MDNSQLNDRLRELLLRMPPKLVHLLAERFQVSIPDDITEYALPSFLVDELSTDEKAALMSNYGYGGRVVCHYLTTGTKQRTPAIDELKSVTNGLPAKPDAFDEPRQDVPLYDYFDIDEPHSIIRVRFRYFHGTQSIYDPVTKTVRDLISLRYGTVVLRPARSLIEVRVSDRAVAIPMVYRTISLMDLPSVFSLDLYTERSVSHFLDWIHSLNNARFTFGEAKDVSSISISAKRTADLRNSPRFKELFEDGFLRGGHVTILKDNDEIKFRIFFRGTHVTFTSFASENDIEFVSDALEGISGGRSFRGPKSILDKYFA